MENSDHAISPTEHLLYLRKKAHSICDKSEANSDKWRWKK